MAIGHTSESGGASKDANAPRSLLCRVEYGIAQWPSSGPALTRQNPIIDVSSAPRSHRTRTRNYFAWLRMPRSTYRQTTWTYLSIGQGHVPEVIS